MNYKKVMFILSVKASLGDLYNQIENHVIRKIDNKEYIKIQSKAQDIYHSLIINDEHVIINSDTAPVFLSYNSYLKNGKEEIFFLDILYSLYIKQTKTINKILLIKTKNIDVSKRISSVFKNISQKHIKNMMIRYNISNYDTEYLIYKDVIVNNLIYDYVIKKMKYGYLNINSEFLFVFKVKNYRYFFNMSILDLKLEPYIKETLIFEFFFLNTKLNSFIKSANNFQIEVLIQILIDDVYHFSKNTKYSKIHSLHALQHSLLFKKTPEIIFYYQENLNNFFHNFAKDTPGNRTFYVYEYKSILGINKCIYSYDNSNEKAFIISLGAYREIKKFFMRIEKYGYMNSTMIRSYFYIFASTQFLEIILRDCFSKRFSAKFIILIHNLKFAELISNNEFINLMSFSTNQIWYFNIYNHMVDIIIKRIINTPISNLLSIKYLYFQYFILEQLKFIVNEKDINDPKNKITSSIKNDFIACKDIIDGMPDLCIISVQVKFIIKLILFTFSRDIRRTRILEFENFLFENERPRQNIFNTNDYSKVRRYLVNSVREEDNFGFLKRHWRYFKRSSN